MPAYATTFLLVAAIFTALSFFPVSLFDIHTDKKDLTGQKTTSIESEIQKENSEPDTRTVVKHVPLPEQVKTIYMTSCVAGTTDFRDRVIKLIDETEINSVIIDIKDFSGTISFPSQQDAWKPAWAEARCGTPRMRE
jgi:hypothetical protein